MRGDAHRCLSQRFRGLNRSVNRRVVLSVIIENNASCHRRSRRKRRRNRHCVAGQARWVRDHCDSQPCSGACGARFRRSSLRPATPIAEAAPAHAGRQTKLRPAGDRPPGNIDVAIALYSYRSTPARPGARVSASASTINSSPNSTPSDVRRRSLRNQAPPRHRSSRTVTFALSLTDAVDMIASMRGERWHLNGHRLQRTDDGPRSQAQ